MCAFFDTISNYAILMTFYFVFSKILHYSKHPYTLKSFLMYPFSPKSSVLRCLMYDKFAISVIFGEKRVLF